jgi:ribosomal protein L37AE/L43A
MAHDDIPEDRQESYPCECGGKIAKRGEYWECDSCDASFFEAKAELV